MKKPMCLGLIILLVLAPALVNAQVGIPPMHHPKEEAVEDAQKDANHAIWFGAGLCLGPIGLAIAYAVPPSAPPPARLMGKSEIYVEEYISAYRKAKKDLQVNAALAGCIPATLVWFSIFFLKTPSNGDE